MKHVNWNDYSFDSFSLILVQTVVYDIEDLYPGEFLTDSVILGISPDSVMARFLSSVSDSIRLVRGLFIELFGFGFRFGFGGGGGFNKNRMW